jgi:hypothetical protein
MEVMMRANLKLQNEESNKKTSRATLNISFLETPSHHSKFLQRSYHHCD